MSGKTAYHLLRHRIWQGVNGACPIETSSPPFQVSILGFHHCFCVLWYSLESCQAAHRFPLSSESFTKQMIKPQEGEGRIVEWKYVARIWPWCGYGKCVRKLRGVEVGWRAGWRRKHLIFGLWNRPVCSGLTWGFPLKWAHDTHSTKSHVFLQATLGGSLCFTASKPTRGVYVMAEGYP